MNTLQYLYLDMWPVFHYIWAVDVDQYTFSTTNGVMINGNVRAYISAYAVT